MLSKYKLSILMIMRMENKTQHNVKRSYIPDHPYRILIIEGSRSGKQMHYQIQEPTSQILIKYICTLKIHMKLSTSF